MKISLIPLFASALMLLVDEVHGDPLTYKVAGGKVSIVHCDKKASGELVIPSSYAEKPVTSIERNAFNSCSRLTAVSIPDSVTSIGDRAFRYCSQLTSVTIGNSVTSIEGWTFDYCGNLTSIIIPESVTRIGKKAFAHCSGLTSVIIPESVTRIEDLAFYDCTELMSVTIPDNVTSIGSRAFEYCGLKSVVIGDSVTSIGWNAFVYCSRLESITFRGNAAKHFEQRFSTASDLVKVFINRGATGFGTTFGKFPVIIQEKINTFSKFAAPFSLNFESKSGSTYLIESSHDLKKWGVIGEVQGTGSSVEFTDWREALFQRQYYRLKLLE
ncbi:leucine-rich repeat domain-containing protein [Verrucomicrobia bacterium]|nr:leucine-rich repeat domain-containing protein [Verrucomicrobiota bacterium]MDA7670389.1 leucine-rich repeat domain-containing protein [Verrucomicrobiota bacterium]